MTDSLRFLALLAEAPVEQIALGDIGRLVRGNGMPKSDLTESGVGAIHYGQIYTHYRTWATEVTSYVSPETASKLAKVDPGDVIITNTSENIDDVCKAVAWLGKEQIVTGGHATVLKHDQDPKYISHWLQTEQFAAQKRKLATGTKVMDVSASALAKIRMPIPPIAIQREIARALDAFEGLYLLLEDELEARKNLNSEFREFASRTSTVRKSDRSEAKRTALGEIATQYVQPVIVQAEHSYTSLGLKWYGQGVFARPTKSGTEIKAATLFAVKPGQFVYNRMFATEGSFGLVKQEFAHAVVSNEFPLFDLDTSKVLPEWLFLKFRDPAIVRAVAAQTTGSTKSRRRWKEEQFKNFVIDLPPIETQAEIVRISALFEQLEDSIAAEIDARRKQLLHYREELLSFESRRP